MGLSVIRAQEGAQKEVKRTNCPCVSFVGGGRDGERRLDRSYEAAGNRINVRQL